MNKYGHIKRAERLEIAILLKKKYSKREIARALERSHTSIVREIRNNSVDGVYDPCKAQHKAYVKRKYSKYQGMKIRERPRLCEYIKAKLKKGWTPEQIAGRLKYIDRHIHYASSKAIYKYLYSMYGQAWCHYLKSRHYGRKKRKGINARRQLIPLRVFIDQRPECINTKERYGDCEVDRVESNHHSKAGLLVVQERKARYYQAIKTMTRTTRENKAAIKKALRPFAELHSLTYDNDISFTRHQEINQELGTQSYFCLPHHPWEKGSLEYTNKLLREYIPKGSDIARYSQRQVNAFVKRLNTRPRKCLNYFTPEEIMRVNNCLKPNH